MKILKLKTTLKWKKLTLVGINHRIGQWRRKSSELENSESNSKWNTEKYNHWAKMNGASVAVGQFEVA